jgi:hypothetical protein
VVQGDGYNTAIVGGPVDFHGYVDAADLIALLDAAFDGTLCDVRRLLLGRELAEHFEVVGADGRIGDASHGLLGLLGRALAPLPGVRSSVRRTRIRFDRAPAFVEATLSPGP